jgi:membrane protease YdiL (CAAX protease family)
MPMSPSDVQTPALVQPIAAASNESVSQLSLPKKLQHLILVLWISFALPIVGSTYYVFGGTPLSTTPMHQSYRLIEALIAELTALMALWYVMGRQGKTRTEIGWNFKVLDILRALGLYITAIAIAVCILLPFQYICRAYTGHFLSAKPLHPLFGFGITFLSVAFTFLNPFFEELIVRAYTMSEVINLGGSRTLAVIVSVTIQISYHLYQGLFNVLALTITFTLFAVYYARTRRIMPVILAHLCSDLLGLLLGVF